MEKAIKHVIIKSINLRNWTTLSNYIATHSLLTNCKNLQDTSLPKKWEKHKENIQKNTFLNSNDNPKNMINMNVRESKKGLTIEAVNHLSFLYRHSNCKDIRNSEEFEQLCKIIQRNVKFLNNDCIVYILKILLSSGVPPETTIIQTLLQFIKFSINDLSIKELIILYHLLISKTKLPLIKSLLHALPIVFQNQVQIELDRSNMVTLKSALKFACLIKHLETLTYITNMLSKNTEILTFEIMTYTLYALYILPKQSVNINLLHRVYDLIIDKGQLLQFKEINFLLRLIINKIEDRDMSFYNKGALDALCTAVLDKNLPFKNNLDILNKLNDILFCHIPLINHAVTEFIDDPYYLTTYSWAQIHNLIKSLCIADYKPQQWATLQSMFLKYILHNDFPIHFLAMNALRLLSLDCYNAELLEKIFTTFYCTHDNIFHTTKFIILILHQSVKTLCPFYNGVTISENLLNELMKQIKFVETPTLGGILTKLVGGTQYIKNGLTTKLGHFINYAIIVQPDGTPMVLSDLSDNIFAEELVSPPGYSKLFILALQDKAYCINTQQLTSISRIQKKSLETLTECEAVVINMNLWRQFSIDKKEQYLHKVLQIKNLKTFYNKQVTSDINSFNTSKNVQN